jgi:hypothetical protein
MRRGKEKVLIRVQHASRTKKETPSVENVICNFSLSLSVCVCVVCARVHMFCVCVCVCEVDAPCGPHRLGTSFQQRCRPQLLPPVFVPLWPASTAWE